MVTGQKWGYVGLIGEYDNVPDETCEEVVDWFSVKPNFRAVKIRTKARNGNHGINAGYLEEQIKRKINPNGSRILAVTGHGDFHFFTYGLCRLADRLSRRYGYIHIDHHCDAWRLPSEAASRHMDSGSFVPYILENTNAMDFVFLGTNITLEDESKWCDKLGMLKSKARILVEGNKTGNFESRKLEKILDEMECKDVYVSFDLDVMDGSEILTGFHGYDCGALSRKSLLSAIKLIRHKKNIIGADINGYSNHLSDVNRAFGGNYSKMDLENMKARSMHLYLDLAASIVA